MEEIWLPIKNFEGYYEVSSLGKVRSLDRIVPMIDGRKYRVQGTMLKLRTSSNNYFCVHLYKDGKIKAKTVHSLVAEHFLVRPEGYVEVCHKNGIHTDNKATNLYYGTTADNANDAVKHGKHFNANKSLCPLNHELVEPNLMRANKSIGARACLACSRGRATVSNNKKRGIELNFKSEADNHYLKIMKT